MKKKLKGLNSIRMICLIILNLFQFSYSNRSQPNIMGNDICTSSPEEFVHQMRIQQQNIQVMYNKIDMPLLQRKNPEHLLDGYSQIHLKNQQKTLIYEGDLKNSKFDGYGKLYKKGKVFYEGEFKEGRFQGWGSTDQYTGQFREGKYDGYGIFKKIDENDVNKMVNFYYEGYFVCGLYNGHGVMIKDVKMPSLRIQEIHNNEGMIEYLEESIQNGNTIATKYQAKEVYIGQFGHGYMHGVGRLFKNNREFSGMFAGGNYVGKYTKGTVIDQAAENKRKSDESQYQTTKSCTSFRMCSVKKSDIEQ